MRLFKQLGYGLFYSIILILLGGGGYLLLKASPSCFDNKLNQDEEQIDCGGSCISCQLKNILPITVSQIDIFQNANKTITVMGELFNPNEGTGAKNFDYTIKITDSGGKTIFSKTRESFLYPRKQKTVIETGIGVDFNSVDNVTISVSNIVWELKEKPPPLIQQNLEISKTAFRQQNQEISLLSGSIRNNNPAHIKKITVKALLFDKNREQLNASFTTLDNLEAFGERSFTVFFPISSETVRLVEPQNTQIILETYP